MAEATDDSNDIEKLYQFGERLNEAKDKSQHRQEYEGIIAAANGSGKAKQLAAQLIPKFFKFFPQLAEQAIEQQWYLCEDEELGAEHNESKAELRQWKLQAERLSAEKSALQDRIEALRKDNELQCLEIQTLGLDRETLSTRLQEAEAKIAKTKSTADDLIAQYRADADTANQQSRTLVEYAKCQARLAVLLELQNRGLDLSSDVAEATKAEDESRRKTFPEEFKDGSD